MTSTTRPTPAVGWAVAGAAVAGTSHTEDGRPCDDSFAYTVVDDDIVIACVADGAGSRPGTSCLGSYVACEAALAIALRADSLDVLRLGSDDEVRNVAHRALDAARTRLMDTALVNGLELGALATTFVFAALTPTSAVFAQVGDGIVVVYGAGSQHLLIPEEKGEYANETEFLTSAGVTPRIVVRHDVRAFALSSDGLRYRVLDLAERRPHEPFFHGLWSQLVDAGIDDGALERALLHLGDAQTGDDLSLVVGGLRAFERTAEQPRLRPVPTRTVRSPSRFVAPASASSTSASPPTVPEAPSGIDDDRNAPGSVVDHRANEDL